MNQNKTLSRLALIGLLGGSASCIAGYQNQLSGPLMTLGKTTNPSTLLSVTNNPAGGESLLSKGESFRMGYFSSLGFGVEVGDVDNFIDDIDELTDALDDDGLSLDEALDIKAKSDVLLPIMGEDARTTLNIGLTAPLMPVAIRSDTLDGVLSFNLQATGLVDISLLDAPLDIEIVGSDVNLVTDSALYFKGGSVATGSIGYSREVWKPQVLDSTLYAGVTANVYHVTLNKQVIALENILEDDDVGDAVQDEFGENTVSTTGVGLDFGLMWSLPHGQVGVTFSNVNEPEFDYGDIGKKCSEIDDATRSSNCVVAQKFSNEIALSETFVMQAQTTVEGAVFTKDKMWLVSGAADLNSTFDFVGRETQYVSASASYFPNSYIIPTVRVGMSQNLVGSELTTIGFGTTLFGIFNFDLSASLDQVEIDGTKAPRQFGFNIGFEESF